MKNQLISWIVFLGVMELPNPTLVLAADSGCVAAQSCVDSGVGPLVLGCLSSNNCSPSSSYGSDPFAVSAGVLATRAIALRKCADRTNQLQCNICYERARQQFRQGYDRPLFHGLLGRASLLVKAEKEAKCPLLENKLPGNGHRRS